eukprot:CAMPEP_0114241242 /NCGR_PEP_ID=MMETSP0058-20121206/9531_1 /TAXON_ID=36894 /ORGANISM="Pyramimonas parkeae, CCMP726" /LENGTH=266 /DNA_ID=CAMNT_0001353761 /DNA_START=136 /DNA_END=936 /DNA_ORIENTATION=-
MTRFPPARTSEGTPLVPMLRSKPDSRSVHDFSLRCGTRSQASTSARNGVPTQDRENIGHRVIVRGVHNGASASPVTQRNNFVNPVAAPLLVDTLAMVRKFQVAGVDPRSAEALTQVMTELLSHLSQRMGDSFVTKSELEKAEIENQASMHFFKHEFSQGHGKEMATLKREIENLKVECEKLRAELRYETDKVTSGQRLDLNLERGRIRDEMQKQDGNLTTATSRLDKDINHMRASIEQMKNDVIKYCVGTIVSTTAVGLGLLRIFM